MNETITITLLKSDLAAIVSLAEIYCDDEANMEETPVMCAVAADAIPRIKKACVI